MATDETVLLRKGGEIAQQVGSQALQQSGGFLSSLVMAPINTVATMGRQAVNGVMAWGLYVAAGIGTVFAIAPDLIPAATRLIGKPEWGSKLGAAVKEGGVGQAALIAGGTGLALAGGAGALSGAWQSLTGGPASEGEAPASTGAKIGQGIGTALTFGAVAAVALGALKSDGVKHDAGAGGEVITPPMPGRAAPARDARLN